jgi:hypothetical protein
MLRDAARETVLGQLYGQGEAGVTSQQYAFLTQTYLPDQFPSLNAKKRIYASMLTLMPNHILHSKEKNSNSKKVVSR